MPVKFAAVMRIDDAVALAEECQHFARGRGADLAVRVFIAGAMMWRARKFAVLGAIDESRAPYERMRYSAGLERICLGIRCPYLAFGFRFPCNQAYIRGGNTHGFRPCAIRQAAGGIRALLVPFHR